MKCYAYSTHGGVQVTGCFENHASITVFFMNYASTSYSHRPQNFVQMDYRLFFDKYLKYNIHETIKEPQLPKHERGLDVTLRVTQCAGRILTNTRPHQLC